MRPRPFAGNLHPTPLAPIAGKDNQTALFSTPLFSARKRNFAPCQPLIASWLRLRQLADGRVGGGDPVVETRRQEFGNRDPVAVTRWQRPGGRGPVAEARWQRPGGRNSVAGTRWQELGGRNSAAETRRQWPGGRDLAGETRRQRSGGRSPAAEIRRQDIKDSYQLTDGKLPRCCRCLYALPSPTLRLF